MTEQPKLWPTPPKRARGRVTIGLEHTITALRAGGRLEPVDDALVALAREAAALVAGAVADPDESRYVCATLLGRYDTVLSHLLGRPDDDTGRPTLGDLLAGALDGPGPDPS